MAKKEGGHGPATSQGGLTVQPISSVDLRFGIVLSGELEEIEIAPAFRLGDVLLILAQIRHKFAYSGGVSTAHPTIWSNGPPCRANFLHELFF